MDVINFFKKLFSKGQLISKKINIIDIRRWDYLCEIDDGYKRTLIQDIYYSPQKINELCGALAYIDENKLKRWLDSAKKIEGLDFKKKLEKRVSDMNISKIQSDKLKAHVANNLAKWDEWRSAEISFNSWLSSRHSDFHD